MIGKTVFSTNIGAPVVVCSDHQSAEALFADVDNLTQSHFINLVSTRQSKPIFTTNGIQAQNARKFILSLLPPDENTDNFRFAMENISLKLEEWTKLSETELNKLSLEVAVGELIYNFAGCLLLGYPFNKN